MKTAIIIAALALIAIAATPAPSATPDTTLMHGIGGWPDFPQGIELDVQAASSTEFTGTLNGDPIAAQKVGDNYLVNPHGIEFNFDTPTSGTITIGINVYDIN